MSQVNEEVIADALSECFKRKIEASLSKFDSSNTFEKSGIVMPKREVWLEYARAALEVIK